VSAFTIDIEDPRRDDITALLERHLEFCNTHTPPENVYALDLTGLLEPSITVFALRRDGELLGVGALKELDASHGEIKSMHTAAAARGLGVGTAIVEHLLATATARGYSRVSLETGSMDAFAPARSLYAKAGFAPSGRFGEYPDSPTSSFMTRAL
jgi:putative acetyltransferase